jgi:hypothetical protein
MKPCVLLAATTFACLLTGCMFKHVSDEELIGKYSADLPDGGTESLELVRGGECIQIIRSKSGPVYEAHGTWKYNAGDRHILFRGIRDSVTETHEINPKIAEIPPGGVSTDLFRTWTGTPVIYLTEDSYYRKL